MLDMPAKFKTASGWISCTKLFKDEESSKSILQYLLSFGFESKPTPQTSHPADSNSTLAYRPVKPLIPVIKIRGEPT